MINANSILENLGSLLETAKTMPTEKIAAVGLIVLGACAILKSSPQGAMESVVEKAQELVNQK